MSQNRWHQLTGGADHKPGVLGFGRRESLYLVASLGMGMLLFKFLDGCWGWSIETAASSAGCLPLLTLGFLVKVVVGKPVSYAWHSLEWGCVRLATWLGDRGVPVRLKPLISIERNER